VNAQEGESLKTYRAELHVHTVLSPCADVEMIPPFIVQEALERGIDLIAITDHNASENVAAVQKAAEGTNLTVFGGIELQTREEVHLLCIFQTGYDLDKWQQIIDQRLPGLRNRPEYFGEQFVVDHTGDFLRREERLLLTSADLSLEEAILGVTRLGGLAIPAHADRKSFGLFANLGFIPSGVPVEAVEISRHLQPGEAVRKFPQLMNIPLIQGGDVHRLDEYLGANEFVLGAPTIAEIRLALAGQSGRSLHIRPFL